jgi:hypothetical protein
MGVGVAADDEIGDETEDGLGFDIAVEGTAAADDVGTPLGVALGPDGAATHAEPNSANTINQRPTAAKLSRWRGRLRLLCQ